MKKIFLILVLLLSFALRAENDGLTIVAVGDANVDRNKIEFLYYLGNAKGMNEKFKGMALELIELFHNDLSFYKKLFDTQNNEQVKTMPDTPNYDVWKTKSITYLWQSAFTLEKGKLHVKIQLFDIGQRKELFTKSVALDEKNLRSIGHEITDDAYRKITQKDSVFKTKIIFVSDRDGTKTKKVKELYMMDFDGRNVHRVTHHNGTVISPSYSKDGTKILYSLIGDKVVRNRNVNLYMYNLSNDEITLISNREGVNSGAIFMPGGDSIALTLSFSGNADIYEMNLKTKDLRPITNHYAVDVDPSITFDGKLMAFLSSRPGKPMIYTMDPTGTEKNVVRVSYVGQFNATPRFSPDGREIVFVSWLEECFDLFRINSDGTGLARLTKEFGCNEEPGYSKDGQFIIFSSKRIVKKTGAANNIYVMDKDGEILGALTKNFGNCITPRWSN